VLTAAALPLARKLEQRFGTPFIAQLPIGKKNTESILSFLKNPNGTPKQAAEPADSASTEPDTLIIGEALFCASLRNHLADEQGNTEQVRIGTFFSCGKELLRPGDYFFTNEADAEKALQTASIKTIYADPTYQDMCSPSPAQQRFISIPHRAVSGRIYDETRARFF
jgi:hypothetical protein